MTLKSSYPLSQTGNRPALRRSSFKQWPISSEIARSSALESRVKAKYALFRIFVTYFWIRAWHKLLWSIETLLSYKKQVT